MSIPHSFQECRAYVRAQLVSPREIQTRSNTRPPMAVTLSRQTGARGRTIGNLLVSRLRSNESDPSIPWTLFDRNLVEQILEDHHLPKDLEKFMPDDRVGELESAINEILGRQPSSWSLFEYSVDTMVRLARAGHCILVGRGGSVITRAFANVLHIRLVGSLERRVQHMCRVGSFDVEEATAFIKKEDSARKKYLKQHFNRDIDDVNLYDLILNTDFLSNETAVQILLAALAEKARQ